MEKSHIPAMVNNEGSTPTGMVLADRVQHFQVPGVSITVINIGVVAWAKRVWYHPSQRTPGRKRPTSYSRQPPWASPFRSYMQNYVSDRLGMNSSDFVQRMAGPLETRTAKAHDIDGMPILGGWRLYPELIAAGLWTTPTDLGKLWVSVKKITITPPAGGA